MVSKQTDNVIKLTVYVARVRLFKPWVSEIFLLNIFDKYKRLFLCVNGGLMLL